MMDSWVKKLQDVANNPAGESQQQQHHGGGDGDEGTVQTADYSNVLSAQGISSLSRSDLERTLRDKEKQYHDLEQRFKALKEETTHVQTEFGAYKAKVQTWRQQAKAAREHDQRTIALLREAAAKSDSASHTTGSIGAGGGNGGDGESADQHHHANEKTTEAYVMGLEEQVKALKEVVRSTAEARDAALLDLTKERSRFKSEKEDLLESLRRANELEQKVKKHHDKEGTNQDPSTTAPEASSSVILLQHEIKDLQEQLRQLSSEKRTLESQLDNAHNDVMTAQRRVTEITAEYEERAAQDSRAQYIKDLEAELKVYRAGGGSMNVNNNNNNNNNFSNNNTSPSGETADAAELSNALKNLQEERHSKQSAERRVEELRSRLADLEAEAEVRDMSLDSTFATLRQLQDTHDALVEEFAEMRRVVVDKDCKIRELERQVNDLKEHDEDTSAALASLQDSNSKYLRDVQERNELVRQLKLELVKAKHQVTMTAAPAPPSHHVTKSVHTAATIPTTSGGGTSTSPQPQQQPQHPHGDVSSLAYWIKTMTYRRMTYAVLGFLFFLFIVSSLFQSAPIAEEEKLQESLKVCELELGRLKKSVAGVVTNVASAVTK